MLFVVVFMVRSTSKRSLYFINKEIMYHVMTVVRTHARTH